MKFLIDNYTTQYNTQPIYLYTEINNLNTCSAALRNPAQSIYDTMDSLSPDVYITHAGLIKQDFIQYMQENPTKQVDVVISVEGMDNNEIDKVDSGLSALGIKCKFIFSSNSISTKNYTSVVIPNAADRNIVKDPGINYKIDRAIFVLSKEDIKEYDPPYHIISNNNNLADTVDICAAELYLASIFSNYNEIIFENLSPKFSQAFFDALLFCDKVYYTSDDPRVEANINKMLGLDVNLKYGSKNMLEDFTQVKEVIKSKHLSINRLLTLVSQFSCKEIIEEIKEQK